MNCTSLARRLGGEVTCGHVVAPGPGHSKHDRSLAVFLDPSSPDHFRVHSFAGDDWRTCREYVQARLGLGETIRQAGPSTGRGNRISPRGRAG